MDTPTGFRRGSALLLVAALALFLAEPAAAAPDRAAREEGAILETLTDRLLGWLPIWIAGPEPRPVPGEAPGTRTGPRAIPAATEDGATLGSDGDTLSSQSGPEDDPERGVGLDPDG